MFIIGLVELTTPEDATSIVTSAAEDLDLPIDELSLEIERER